MKIGVLTLPFSNNYGGYLQCYALMTVLKGMGHDVELIDRKAKKQSLYAKIKFFLKNIIKLLLLKHPNIIVPGQEAELRNRGVNMFTFVDKYIQPRTKMLFTSADFNHYVENNFDAVVDKLNENYSINVKAKAL